MTALAGDAALFFKNETNEVKGIFKKHVDDSLKERQ